MFYLCMVICLYVYLLLHRFCFSLYIIFTVVVYSIICLCACCLLLYRFLYLFGIFCCLPFLGPSFCLCIVLACLLFALCFVAIALLFYLFDVKSFSYVCLLFICWLTYLLYRYSSSMPYWFLYALMILLLCIIICLFVLLDYYVQFGYVVV